MKNFVLFPLLLIACTCLLLIESCKKPEEKIPHYTIQGKILYDSNRKPYDNEPIEIAVVQGTWPSYKNRTLTTANLWQVASWRARDSN